MTVENLDKNVWRKENLEAPVVISRSKGSKRWVSLHHHSTFSFLDGYGLPEEHVERAAELDMPALALTEHGNISSHVRLEKRGKELGVKPIYGCEFYCGGVKEDDRTQLKNHLTVLAATGEGYRNLLRLTTEAWAKGFYYEPTVSGESLARHRSGLVILSGCTGSLLATSLVGGKHISKDDASYLRAREVAQRFKKTFGDAYYLEVQAFPELPNTCRINEAYERLGVELGIPLVATHDIHYPHPEDNELQRILHNVRGGNRQTLEEQSQEWEYDILLTHPPTDRDVYRKLRGTGLSKQGAIDAILATEDIAARCNVELPHMNMLRYPLPVGAKTAKKLYWEWLQEGWHYRGIDRKSEKEQAAYRERLRYETSLISGKDYIDYFLIVSDLVRFAKNAGILVGPARGSAAASLVCYLLRITEVDPMVFTSLVFERFIDVTRQDLPDIDLDFDDDRRDEIWTYAEAKYGPAYVGTIGNFTGYKSKNALDDVARAFRIPQWEVDKVKDLLIDRSSGDLRASATIEDTAAMFEAAGKVFEDYPNLRYAMRLEGNYKGMSVHAAGLIITPEPVTNVCAFYERPVRGEPRRVISMDKYDAEKMGLLKIDVLGLTTLGATRQALGLIGMSIEELYALPFDDPSVYETLKAGDTVGIFQFEGWATRHVNLSIAPDNFGELTDISALSRPGPLHSGAWREYADVKKGRAKAESLGEICDRITAQTYGQIVYQEQILRVVREIGQFDWTAAAYIRKIISRKIGEQEFNRQWGKFLEGALSVGVDEDTARKIWGYCITAGAYAFNYAHCVAYGMLTYWTVWLKTHYPLEFYCSWLSKKQSQTKELLRDAIKHGIEILPPDPNVSGLGWTIDRGDDGQRRALRGGLLQVPGIGEKTARAMLDYRAQCAEEAARESFPESMHWEDYLAVRGIGAKTVEKITAFCQHDDPYDAMRLSRKLDEVREWIRAQPDLPDPTHTAFEVPTERGSNEEVVWVGVVIKRNLRDIFEINFNKTGEALDPESISSPELNEYAFMVVQDETEIFRVKVDRFLYPHFRKMIWSLETEKDFLLVRGYKPGRVPFRLIHGTEMWLIDGDE